MGQHTGEGRERMRKKRGLKSHHSFLDFPVTVSSKVCVHSDDVFFGGVQINADSDARRSYLLYFGRYPSREQYLQGVVVAHVLQLLGKSR